MTDSMRSRTPGDGAAFTVDVERRPEGVVVVHLHGELDMANAADLVELLGRAGGTPPLPVVVDLSELAFVDSSGLNALVTASRSVEEAGGSIVFAQPSAHVSRLLEIVGLPETVRFDESLERALRTASGS
jgi:anti-anti-sigma factor